MDIKNIIDLYGFNDYYEMSTGRLYELSNISYDPIRKISTIPVLQQNGEDGKYYQIGNIQIPGNIKEEMGSR